MRLLQMMGVAAQAEGIRLRRELHGTARQAGWIAAAALFGAAALATAHVAIVAQLMPRHGLAAAAAMMAAADLVIAGALALLARRPADPVAEEARALRETMLAAMARPEPLLGASAPLIGAVTAEAVAAWMQRR